MNNIDDAESATKMLPHLAAFIAVVDSGSFSAAARRLGVDKTLLSRRVSTLERGLGVRLLQRTTRSVSLTDAGRRLRSDAGGPLSDAIAALLIAGQPAPVEGTVRVATLPIIGPGVWAPVLESLRASHPGLSIELQASDRFVNLVGEGVDVALRSGRPPDSNLVTRTIGTWRFVLCAAPAWLASRRGIIHGPDDVTDDWVVYGGVSRARSWTFARGTHTRERQVQAVATVDQAPLQMQLVLGGLGVGALPVPLAAQALTEGRLERVLPEWRLEHEHRLAVVLPSREYVPHRVKTVIEAVERQVRRVQPHWDALAGVSQTAGGGGLLDA